MAHPRTGEPVKLLEQLVLGLLAALAHKKGAIAEHTSHAVPQEYAQALEAAYDLYELGYALKGEECLWIASCASR